MKLPQPAGAVDETEADNAKAADRACLAMIAQGYYWNGEAWARNPPPATVSDPVAGVVDAPRCFQSLDMLKGSRHRFGEVYDDPNGCFVRYADHARIVAEKEAEYARRMDALASASEANFLRAEAMAAELERLRNDWSRMTQEAQAIQMRHLDNHNGDIYHAMQSLVVRFGNRDTGPMTTAIDAAITTPSTGTGEVA